MKKPLFQRLRTNGFLYLSGALLLLLVVPGYQLLVLAPLHYSPGGNAAFLSWINHNTAPFLLYRILLLIAFALLLSFPFSLYRVIVAQEIVAQQEYLQAEQGDENDEGDEKTGNGEATREPETLEMPEFAWRGKGFTVLANWAGILGITLYLLGALIGTLYFVLVSGTNGNVPQGFNIFYSLFSICTNTVGIGLLAISSLFFGAMIARAGTKLWPLSWVGFAYLGLAVTALLSGSAVAVASNPQIQAALTTPATLIFALWILWLALMLIRLRAE